MLTAESVSVPALTVSEPVVVPTIPPRVSAPAPSLVRPKVAPETGPFSVSVLAVTEMVRLPVSVTAPVSCVSVFVPTNVKSPPMVSGFAMAAATDASSAPPFMVSVPGVAPEPPNAKVAEPAMSVPALTVVPPA